MYEAVKKAGVVNMLAFNYRRTPAVQLAKKYISEGALGRILDFRGHYLQDWSADPKFASFLEISKKDLRLGRFGRYWHARCGYAQVPGGRI